jgi:hypothetical protein
MVFAYSEWTGRENWDKWIAHLNFHHQQHEHNNELSSNTSRMWTIAIDIIWFIYNLIG